jgi:F-box and WD-40 domain protein 1/11
LESQRSTTSAGATAGSSSRMTTTDPGVDLRAEPSTSAMATPQPPPAQTAIPTPNMNVPNTAPVPNHAAPPPPPPPVNEVQAQAALHQAHIPAPENAPARIFKLQFDARKIVCCSQAPVIVGWDFYNGDPELEEASRFFATVD